MCSPMQTAHTLVRAVELALSVSTTLARDRLVRAAVVASEVVVEVALEAEAVAAVVDAALEEAVVAIAALEAVEVVVAVAGEASVLLPAVACRSLRARRSLFKSDIAALGSF